MNKVIVSVVLGFSMGCNTYFCYDDCDNQHEEDIKKCGSDENCKKEADLKAYHCAVQCAKSAESIGDSTSTSTSTSTSGTPTTTNDTNQSTSSPVDILDKIKYPE